MGRGKRRQGAMRTPSGRISRSQEAQRLDAREAMRPVLLRRMRDRLLWDAKHPWFGFPLGRLAIEEYISADEFDAARSWAELTWRWSQIVGVMLPKCKAIEWDSVRGRALGSPPDEDMIERLKERKDDADTRIRAAGPHALAECTRVVICDEEPLDRILLRKALRTLLDNRGGNV